MTPRVLILGGGIAGLTVAYRLREALRAGEVEVTLLEASDRLGGKIRTERPEGFVVETGPDSMLATKPWGIALADELGLGGELQPTIQSHRRAFVNRGGRLYPLPEGLSGLVPMQMGPLLRTPLLSWAGRIRAGMEPWIPRRRDLREESVAAFVRRRFGTEAYDWLIQPLLTGIYGGGGEELGIESAFPKLVAAERAAGSVIRGLQKGASYSVRGSPPQSRVPRFATPFVAPRLGMEQLVEGLASAVRDAGVELRTNTGATDISVASDGYRISLDTGPDLHTQVVVCAVPAPSASQLLRQIDPELADLLADIPFASVSVATFALSVSDVPHPLDGYGYLNPERMAKKVMAVTWSSSKFEERSPTGTVLIRAFIRGEWIDSTDAEIQSLVATEFSDMLGIQRPPLWFRVDRWPASMPRYQIGHASRVNTIEARVASHPGLFLTGHSYRGVGIPDTIRAASDTANGTISFLRKALDEEHAGS